ncbi:MAG: hypothetical protein M9887_00210 [Chitinophagales bacterium]|nr:hypothetical protein [Chitinophagales bacterium]
MKMKWLSTMMIVFSLLTLSSCNRGEGCPASKSPDRMVNVNDNKQGNLDKKKASKATRSTIMPKEVKIGKR